MTYRRRCRSVRYHGVYFRSTLEARWAATFDRFGLSWIYEPEENNLSSGSYTVDFWLPEPDLYVEIKPVYSFCDVERYKELVTIKQRPMLFIAEQPRVGRYHLRYFGVKQDQRLLLQAQFAQCNMNGALWVMQEDVAVALAENTVPVTAPQSLRENSPFIVQCMSQANSLFDKTA